MQLDRDKLACRGLRVDLQVVEVSSTYHVTLGYTSCYMGIHSNTVWNSLDGGDDDDSL